MWIEVFPAGLYFYLVSCLSHDTILFSDLFIVTNMFYSRYWNLITYVCWLESDVCFVV